MIFICLTVALSPAIRSEVGLVRVTGRYTNNDYAYSVAIPRGLVGHRSDAPAPNHGFGIDISKSANSYLSVDASYNSADWRSFEDAVQAVVSQLKGEGSRKVNVISRAPARLGGLRALRYVIRYDHPESEELVIQEVILAFRKNRGGVAIVYTLALYVPERRYKHDRVILHELQQSWRLRPLP